MDEKKIEELKRRMAESPFSRPTHSSPTVPVKDFFRSLRLYRDEFENNLNASNSELVKAMTPKFQRENTKWSREMQISFVENVVCGFRADLMLYYVSSEDAGYCNILDGLQRITSVQQWTDGEFPIFDSFYYEDFFRVKGRGVNRPDLILKIYEFPSHLAACEHYIAMNKNITHSPEDLKVAYDFVKSEKEKVIS